jgi:hypothetical protein
MVIAVWENSVFLLITLQEAADRPYMRYCTIPLGAFTVFEYRSSTVVRGITCLAASLALFVSITSPLIALTSENVNVLTAVNRKVVWRATESGVAVSGNIPWTLYAETPQGVLRIDGAKTASDEVALPKGTTAYTIVSE